MALNSPDTNTAKSDAGGGQNAKESEAYFSSYMDIDVHSTMLKDAPRTLAYKHFIEKNKALFVDKVVVDIGAGTGILSLFAAAAGAKQVYAIEASGISQLCQEIVTANNMAEKITVLHGAAEDVNLPNDVKADILISEWMGFYLLHESMLQSIIVARDRFLSEDGLILPSSASVYLCPVSMKDFYKEHFERWREVYGFNFSPVERAAKRELMTQPQIVTLSPDQCLARPELVTHLDLMYVAEEDVRSIKGSFRFDVTKNAVLQGFACWFDVEFEGPSPVRLDTSPAAESTHWQQTVILLPEPLLVSKTENVQCLLEMAQDPGNHRRYNISICIPEEESEEEEEDEDLMDEAGASVEQMLVEARESAES